MSSLSIIIPYRNREDFLPRTLCSILSAKKVQLQLILVDNGSSDSSPQICSDFEKRHHNPNLEIINISEPSGGVCRARNAGLTTATSPYVYFFDSDDELSPLFLSDALKRFSNATLPLDIVAAPTKMVFQDGRTKVRYTSRSATIADQVLTGMLSTQTMVFRKDFLIQAGGWNEELPKWNDWELGIRSIRHNARIVWLEAPCNRIYQHQQSLTSMPPSAGYAAMRKALQSSAPLLAGNCKAERALAVRALLLAEAMRRAGNPVEARQTEREFPLPPILRRILLIHARLFNKGVWRLARLLI